MVKPKKDLKEKIKSTIKNKSKISDETLNSAFAPKTRGGLIAPETLKDDQIEAIAVAISNKKENETLWDVAEFVSQELGVFIPHDYVREIYTLMRQEYAERNAPEQIEPSEV